VSGILIEGTGQLSPRMQILLPSALIFTLLMSPRLFLFFSNCLLIPSCLHVLRLTSQIFIRLLLVAATMCLLFISMQVMSPSASVIGNVCFTIPLKLHTSSFPSRACTMLSSWIARTTAFESNDPSKLGFFWAKPQIDETT